MGPTYSHGGGVADDSSGQLHSPVRPCLRLSLGLALSLGICVANGWAATKYWDTNGATSGAGGSVPAGTWNTGGLTNWTTNSNGTSATTTWTAGDSAIFAAGSDATGNYTVTLNGTQTASGVSVEEGFVNFDSGGSGALDF